VPDPDDLRPEPTHGEVLSEVFGDEAVVVNLRTGTYYALDPEATTLWSLLLSEGSRNAMVEARVRSTGRARAEVFAEVTGFLSFLAGEQLADFGRPLPVPAEPGWPGVHRFTDVADLLLLDPVHDVDLDGFGWPTVDAEQQTGS
jgi:hypothetical protein